jgi:hypothetical protein
MTSFRVALICTLSLLAGSACYSDAEPLAAIPKHIKPDEASPSAVHVSQREYKLDITSGTARAGTIDFVVDNQGKQAHEFVIVPFSHGRYGEPLAEIEHFPPGESRAIRADLAPGKYVFVCLMVSLEDDQPQSHMALGMNTPFEVAE